MQTTLTAKQLACLASPARNEVFMQLRVLGKASVGELARSMEKRPEAVHYHVKGLVAAGLAKESERRPGVKKPECVYEPVGKRLRLPKVKGKPEIARLVRKSVAAGFRQTIRGYMEASRRLDDQPRDAGLMHVIRLNTRLQPNDAKEFIRRIEEVVSFADEHRSDSGQRLVWSSIVFPK